MVFTRIFILFVSLVRFVGRRDSTSWVGSGWDRSRIEELGLDGDRIGRLGNRNGPVGADWNWREWDRIMVRDHGKMVDSRW
jgi:hypothetical protein